ncbi:hypothetical protein AB2L28_02395 [Kineococcus sp. TBRC 1896]|uniref:Uncharacterized protein n=1 Tax=Kineococcus mangrovi TaxID=1660183 RepID=A0ABV4HXT7_9ACTN
MSEHTPEENPGQENPGTQEAAESPALDGYGNDTGFAEDAEDEESAGDARGASAPE